MPGVGFEREYGCTESEWLRWLPGAVNGHELARAGPGTARVAIGGGHLALRWTVLPPRQIALARLPRMTVRFDFVDVATEQRLAFMRHFDLYLQRGGG